MKKILLFLLLLPSLVFAGTNDQLPDASRTDYLFVQQTWGGGGTTRGAITAQMIIDLIVADDIDGLAAAVSGNADVIASFKDAATVISAIDTYLGGAGWRADLSALVTANSAKVGITVEQANAIIANTAKDGITAQQAADIIANNAKDSYPGPELTADELAAMQAANTPSAANPLATQNDIAAAGGGDITGVTAGTGLSGGGLTGDVTLNLANTAVTPGAYTNVNITVDAQGRVTAIANGTDNTGTDSQTLSINGSDLTISAGNTVTLPAGSGAVDSVNGETGVVVIDATDVGLGNVTNTSDAAKPVSTAQQTALDAKASIASPTFTGTVTAPAFATSAADGDRVQILPENTARTPGAGEVSFYNDAGQIKVAENGLEYDLVHSGDTTFAAPLGVDDNYVTDAQLIVVSNTSGTNTGDQTIPASGVDFDPAGTDNSTNVSIAVGRDYISISGQVLTLGAVDLAADVVGLLPATNIAADIARDSELPTEATVEAQVFDADNTGDMTTTGTITAGAFASTAADGDRVQVFQDNTTRTPGAGEESIYNEAGQLKVAEGGIEYDIVHSGDMPANLVTGASSSLKVFVLDDCTTATGMATGDLCFEF